MIKTPARLRERLRDFIAARGGNVTMIFALATIPIIGFVGAAVDYSRANSARTAMQAALDSTALMLSKEAQGDSSSTLQTNATNYFKAMFNRPEALNVVITPTFTSPAQGNFTLQVKGSATVPAKFVGIIGTNTMNISATSQVMWGMKKLEVALALDNTGSMSSSNKMTNLKTAAKNLITTLKNAAKKDGDVKIAIIPFDTTVNLGTSYKNNDWFEYGSLSCGNNSCTNNNWKNYWEGCVRDRTYPYDAQDDEPTSSAKKFPVYDCGSLTTLMPLSYNWTSLSNKIDDMQPNGNTNVTIGLTWAWHALTQNAPLSEAAAPATDLDKVIILLTDGDNTESWKNSNNTKVTNQSSIDARTQLACDNIKAANIRIYAIRVIDGNADLLSSCATNSSMYFNVQQASQLNSVFSSIAQNLANLRLSK